MVPLGTGKRAESQVMSVLLPVQRLRSDTAAAAVHLRRLQGNAWLPSLPLWHVFSPGVEREGEANP